MKHITKRYSLFLCLVLTLSFVGVQAQDIDNANTLYKIHAFERAIEVYEKAFALKPGDAQAYARQGDCYRRINKMKEAAEAYAKAINTGKAEPNVFYEYGLVLKALERYSEAKEWFKSYASVEAKKGKHFEESCVFAEEQKNVAPAYEVFKELVNSSEADFGLTVYKNKAFYTSSRKDMGNASSWINKSVSQLFVAETNWQGALKKPELLNKGIQAKTNIGPATFDNSGTEVYYTVNNFEDGIRWMSDNGLVLSIEQAIVNSNGNWTEEKALFSGGSHSVAFPTISEDGKTLYFASDQAGGEGGFDLYMSKKEGNIWGKPVNLGKTINTPGDEITPYIDGDDLYFSSNWHFGLGGFDVFKITKVGNNWSNLLHLGNEVNSTRDDICFVYNSNKKDGYFSSNRLGGKGDLDIYRVKPTGEAPTKPVVVDANPPGSNKPPSKPTTNNNNNNNSGSSAEITLKIINAANLEGVPFANIDFSECSNGGSYATDAQGVYVFNVPAGYDCKAAVSKNGFATKIIDIRSSSMSERTLEIVIEPDVDGYAGFVYDATTRNAIANTLITAVETQTNDKMQVLSNNAGRYVLDLKPNGNYAINFSKTGYINENITVKTLDGTNKNILGQQELKRSGNPYPDGKIEEESIDNNGNASSPAWAVQVGVFSNPNITELQKLKVYGNVFREPKGELMSYKVGTYSTKEEATLIKNRIFKETGLYKDAWVTPVIDSVVIKQTLIEGEIIPGVDGGGSEPTPAPVNDEIAPPGVSYKVQLGVYKNLQWFPEEKYADMGVLEVQPKKLPNGDMANVVLLGNYKTKTEAETKKAEAVQRGLTQAFVVAYKNGKPLK